MNEMVKNIIKGLDKPRSGWIMRGIGDKAETVLQHTKKVVRAAKIFGKYTSPGFDYTKFVKMALYHDFAEYKEKDYIPGEISKGEKYAREKKVMEMIRDSILPCGREVHDLWIEFEAGETEEAKLLFQLDKLDAAIQALEYEKLGHNSVIDFYPDALQKVSNPVLNHILEILLRKEFTDVSFYEQYFLLLELNGDEKRFYEHMQSRES